MVKIELIDINKLKPNPQNPRTIKDSKFKKLIQSLKDSPKMLEIRPVVYNSKFMILGGLRRWEAAKALKYKQVPAINASHLTPKEQKEFIIKDNLQAGEWDTERLRLGWTVEQLTIWGMDAKWTATYGEVKDDGHKVPVEIKTSLKAGDLIVIGPHRLICGDSRDPETVKTLLAGAKPTLMVTDPPYGVNYDPQWRNDHNIKSVGANRATGKVKNDDISDWTESWKLSPASVAYVWHGGKYASVVQNSLESVEYEIRSQIIWGKQKLVMSRGNYHWRHEPCWYAVRKGSNASWIGDRKQTTLWEIQNNNPFGGSKEKQTGHGTQKPVECMARPMRNHSGDVYEPFLGSGTTMVAAEMMHRSCFAIEIEPKYCEITIQRMVASFPDLKVLVNGKPYK